MSKPNYKREAARLRKIADQVEVVRDRMWNTDDQKWDNRLAQAITNLQEFADQMEADERAA